MTKGRTQAQDCLPAGVDLMPPPGTGELYVVLHEFKTRAMDFAASLYLHQ